MLRSRLAAGLAQALGQLRLLQHGLRGLRQRTGLRKQQCLAVADLMLMPAGLGLGLLDALACGVPLVTSLAPGLRCPRRCSRC